MNELSPASKRFRAVASALALAPLIMLTERQPAMREVPEFCLSEERGILVASSCPNPSLWFASPRIRKAAGEPLCWWSASESGFTELPGVGPALAERIASYRDAGGELSSDGLQSVRGVGPSVAERALPLMTAACARIHQ